MASRRAVSPVRNASLSVVLAAAIGVPAVAGGEPAIDLGRGPVTVHVPSSYDHDVPAPLLLLLHGYGMTGVTQEAYMQLAPVADAAGILYLHPDGTTDGTGSQFWNATDACCDFFGAGIDDSSYLRALIDEMRSLYNVDPRRIYIVGHSNGGFMTYRMACDHSDVTAAVVSLAGATWLDPQQCPASSAVHVLQVHGTADTSVPYAGGCIGAACYPGAVATVAQWTDANGCAPFATPGPPLDLDQLIPGAETQVERHVDACRPGGSAELWTITGGGHAPNLTPGFAQFVIDHLLAHPKPCFGDLDGADGVGFVDLTQLIAAWGPCGVCVEDLDGDGVVGFGDLTALLGAWGPCV